MSAEDGAFTFHEILQLLIFLGILWFAGKFAEFMTIPALVLEILVGCALGPTVADFVPHSQSMQMLGELGLILLAVEAGLSVDLDVLRQVGIRGLIIGVIGSTAPFAICFCIRHIRNSQFVRI
jgi:Kef-type K+ transport system membrane component KefB